MIITMNTENPLKTRLFQPIMKGELMTKNKRNLKDLNLLDRFLFDEAMENPENMKMLLDIILGQDTVLKCLPQSEKEERTSPLNRFVKLDIYALDEHDTVYNTEVQKKDTKNLPKRSRLYQGIIDSKLLAPGTVDFNAINNVFIIIIAPFDLFGYGLYKYTFQMGCKEVPDLWLDDGATRIFLNTHGTNPEGASQELIELLGYMEHSTEEMVNTCTSKRIHQMHKNISSIRSNEEAGVRYMQLWEELLMERQEGKEEGKKEGLQAIYDSILELLSDIGEIPPEIHDKIMSETDFDTLTKWLKTAAKAESIEAFLNEYF